MSGLCRFAVAALVVLGAMVGVTPLSAQGAGAMVNVLNDSKLMGGGNSCPQVDTLSVRLYFPQGGSALNTTYRDNGTRLADFERQVMELNADPAVRLLSVEVKAYASPEGDRNLNVKLARRRAANIARLLRADMPGIAAAIIAERPQGIDWDGLAAMVRRSRMKHRREVLAVLRSTPECTYRNGELVDSRVKRLMDLRGGVPYRYMFKNFFPSLRAAGTYIICRFERVATPAVTVEPAVTAEPDTFALALSVPAEPIARGVEPAVPADTAASVAERKELLVEDPFIRHGYVKTNVPAWGMLWLNGAFEIDIAEHFSGQLPIYYSGWNYFKSTRKFRTFAIMPELRWWTRRSNEGFFVGVHFGMAYYNVAFGKRFRYQDHDGDTPALGGGVAVGGRVPLDANRRWWLEMSAGFGIYRLDYDRFFNRKDGPLYDRRRSTFYGIDNASISIVYRFEAVHGKKGVGR